jgi:indolepyruvate ferredoxin oxidoreductase
LHWGRATVAAPGAVEAATAPRVEPVDLAAELAAYQSDAYAREWAEFVAGVGRRDPGTQLTDAVGRQLFKLMAYKDEYEVARLHLDPVERAKVAAEFGEGAKVRYKLHPPVLRALGMKRKLTIPAFLGNPLFRVLRRMKRLRGTKLDVFGFAKVRRVERQLPAAYRAVVERALERVGTADYELLVEICELPDMIRGYEDIKLASVERFHARAAELLERLEQPPALTVIAPR